MITISRNYDVKREYKIAKILLKHSTPLITYHYNSFEIEKEITNTIDNLVDRWKRLQVIPNTFISLHRYCLVYRHHIVHTLSQPNFYCDREKMYDFRILTKDEFLQSYSYLTEKEYDNTLAIKHLISDIQWMGWHNDKLFYH